ncbi:MAG: V-type ATPase subunit subunit G family protein [Candidatus Bathyarchaeota archaeon]
MEMQKILSLGGRLQKLLEKTEAEANEIISEAQMKADRIVAQAKDEAEKRRLRAQRRTGLDEFLADAEAEAKKEAKKVTKDYAKRVEEIKTISEDKLKEAVDFVMSEVLPQ